MKANGYTDAEIAKYLQSQQAQLDAMTIEGYSRAGVYTDVTSQATKTEGEYVYQYEGDPYFGMTQKNTNFSCYRLSVSKGEKYRVTGTYSQYIATVYLYDENDTCIGTIPETRGENYAGDVREITISDGVSYIAVNEILRYNCNAKIEKFAVSEGLDFTLSSGMTIEGYKREEVYTDITSQATKHEQYYIYGTKDGTANPISITSYDYFELDVREGEKYRIDTLQAPTMHGLLFTNASGSILECYPPKSAEGTPVEPFSGDFVVPVGASKLYVNQISKYNINAKIQKLQESNMNFVRDTSDAGITSHLTGKKLACVGDSITEASNVPAGSGYFKNYAELVAERNGMTVYKDGKGGSTMTNVSTQRPFSVDRYLNVPNDVDIITIFFGWNDSYYAKDNLGDMNSTDDTTFYGAYKKVIEYYMINYPTVKIGLIAPYGPEHMEPFREAVRELSEFYGIACLDLSDPNSAMYWCNINDDVVENAAKEARWSALTYDGTHLNQAGHEYLSTIYEAFILSL